MPRRALLFDLDGTLIDSGLDLADAVNYTLDILGLPQLDIDEIISYVGDGVQQLVRRSLSGVGASQSDIDKALDIFTDHYRDNCTTKTVTYDGVVMSLEALSRRYRLAVLTNKSQIMAELVLEKLNLSRFFDALVGGDTLNVRKPDPAVVDHLAERLTIPVSDMVMIGDHHTDLAVAQAANIPSIFCSFGMGHTNGLVPTVTINSFTEIESAVAAL